jgi:hypothetical protein
VQEDTTSVAESSGKVPEEALAQLDWDNIVMRLTAFAGRRLRGGMPLGRDTYAGDLHAGIAVEDRPQLIDGSGWAGGHSIDLQEHSMKLGSYGSVLTLLWHKWQ